jgi:hypothetical protein
LYAAIPPVIPRRIFVLIEDLEQKLRCRQFERKSLERLIQIH